MTAPRTTSAPFLLRPLTGGLLGLTLLLAALHFGAGLAGAQRSEEDEAPPKPTFRLHKVDEIVSNDPKVKIREIVRLGKDNVFIVRTDKTLEVFRLDTSGSAPVNRRLTPSIDLIDPVLEIAVLDDMASFLVRTKAGIAVYSVSKTGVTPAQP